MRRQHLVKILSLEQSCASPTESPAVESFRRLEGCRLIFDDVIAFGETCTRYHENCCHILFLDIGRYPKPLQNVPNQCLIQAIPFRPQTQSLITFYTRLELFSFEKLCNFKFSRLSIFNFSLATFIKYLVYFGKKFWNNWFVWNENKLLDGRWEMME